MSDWPKNFFLEDPKPSIASSLNDQSISSRKKKRAAKKDSKLQVFAHKLTISMGVRYSNGKVMWLGGPFEYRTFCTINRLFSVQFSDHHLNTGPFDNQTQIYHSNIRLVQYSDGYCIQAFGIQMVTVVNFDKDGLRLAHLILPTFSLRWWYWPLFLLLLENLKIFLKGFSSRKVLLSSVTSSKMPLLQNLRNFVSIFV